MQIHFFLLTAETYPVEYVDEESTLLIDTGLKDREDDAVIPMEDLRFMTTLLINSPKPEPAVSQFKAWWAENAGGDVTFESLASEIAQLEPNRAEALDDMEDGGWSIKSNFVAFSASSEDARNEARQFICECELRTH